MVDLPNAADLPEYTDVEDDDMIIMSRDGVQIGRIKAKDIRAINDRRAHIDALGGNQAALETAITNARSLGIPVTGNPSGLVTISHPIDMTNVDIDLLYKDIRAGSNFAAALTATTITTGSTGAEYDLEKYGPALDIGGNPGTFQHLEKTIRYLGDYSGSEIGQSRAFMAVRIEGDQRAMTSYDVAVSRHRGDGLVLWGDTEKKRITYRADHLYDGYAISFLTPNGALTSPDEVVIDFAGTFFDCLIFIKDSLQVSVRFNLAVESINPADKSKYIIQDGGRKSSTYSGEIRGIVGKLINVETITDSYTAGGPIVTFDDLTIIQHYDGDIRLINPKMALGRIIHSQVNTNQNVGTSGIPGLASFAIGGVVEGCDLTYVTRRNQSAVGARIGISDYLQPLILNSSGTGTTRDPIGSAFNGKRIRLVVKMGSSEGSSGAQTSPNSHTAFRADYGDGSIVDGAYLRGNALIDAKWQRGRINVMADWLRTNPTITVDEAATGEIRVEGPMDFAEVLALTVKTPAGATIEPEGMTIEYVNEFGAAMSNNGSRWVVHSPLILVDASMRAKGSPWNSPKLKDRGVSATNLTDCKQYTATGPADSDAWVASDGTTIGPTWLAATAAYEARADAAAGGAAWPTWWKLVMDRMFHDLIVAGTFDPVTPTASIIKGLYITGQDIGQARVNAIGSHWGLDLYGAFTHVPFRGLQPPAPNTNTYAEVSGWAGNKLGTNEDNIAFGACAEELNGSGNVFSSVGSLLGTISMVSHRGDGGNNCRLNSSTALQYPALLPAHVAPRLGIAYTPNAVTQTMRMHGGPQVTGNKSNATYTLSEVFLFRTSGNYLPLRMSMGLVGQGAGWTRKNLKLTLDALRTARDAMIAHV